MLNGIKKTFYFCFIASLLVHGITLYYDQIKLNWEFKFSKEQEKTMRVIEQNKKIVEVTQHKEEDKELLVEYLEKEKEEFIEKAKKDFLKEQQLQKILEKQKKLAESVQIKKQKSGNSKDEGMQGTDTNGSSAKKDMNSGGLSTVAQDFSGFISKEDPNAVKQKKTQSQSHPVTITYLGEVPKDEMISEVKKCEGNVYVGLGLYLTGPPQFAKNLKDLSEYTPWGIASVAKGYVADKNQIEVGDVFLGIKDSNGRFWEGNRYLSKGLKAGTEVEALFRQNNKVVSKFLRLEEICYDKKVSK